VKANIARKVNGKMMPTSSARDKRLLKKKQTKDETSNAEENSAFLINLNKIMKNIAIIIPPTSIP